MENPECGVAKWVAKRGFGMIGGAAAT